MTHFITNMLRTCRTPPVHPPTGSLNAQRSKRKRAEKEEEEVVEAPAVARESDGRMSKHGDPAQRVRTFMESHFPQNLVGACFGECAFCGAVMDHGYLVEKIRRTSVMDESDMVRIATTAVAAVLVYAYPKTVEEKTTVSAASATSRLLRREFLAPK